MIDTPRLNLRLPRKTFGHMLAKSELVNICFKCLRRFSSLPHLRLTCLSYLFHSLVLFSFPPSLLHPRLFLNPPAFIDVSFSPDYFGVIYRPPPTPAPEDHRSQLSPPSATPTAPSQPSRFNARSHSTITSYFPAFKPLVGRGICHIILALQQLVKLGKGGDDGMTVPKTYPDDIRKQPFF